MFWVCIAAGAAVSAKKGQNRTLAALEQRYAAFSQKHGFNLGGPVWRGANYAMGEMGGRSVKKLRSGKSNPLAQGGWKTDGTRPSAGEAGRV